MIYHTGDKPGNGRYRCVECGQIIVLDDVTDTLPVCPQCGDICYKKID